MIQNVLIEMTLFQSAKETDNKLRWDSDIKGTKFSLYIPKWRVPKPWPAKIWVKVIPRRGEGDDQANLSLADVTKDSALTNEPIIVTVIKCKEHTETIRYSPSGNPSTWEIGEPYIPHPLTFDEAERLRLIVLWDIISRGSF